MDDDLDSMSREELIAEVKKLRMGIRQHRDSSEHDLCWYHPDLWSLLPERSTASLLFLIGLNFFVDASSIDNRWTSKAVIYRGQRKNLESDCSKFLTLSWRQRV